MHKLLVSSSLALLAPGLAAQAVITPFAYNNNPNLGVSVITADGGGNALQTYQQIEMNPIGGGLYRTIVTAQLVGSTDTTLVLGTIDMNTNPPTWTPEPNATLAAINQPGAAPDDFAGSISDDGLVLVWDNYAGVAAPTFPNVPSAKQSFVCVRSSTSVPFAVANVFAIAGVPSGGVDTKIGNRLANGNIELFHIGNLTGQGPGPTNGNIYRSEINPTTGAMVSGPILAVQNSGRANWFFCHSPCPMRDGAGNPVAVVNSEYITAPYHSDGMFSPGISNDGLTEVIGDGTLGGVYYWIANPAVVGGTINWASATAAGAYGDPSQLEGTFLANCDLTSGSGRLAAFSPIRPTAPGSFISIVAIGTTAAPYTVPPVIGNILLFPTVGTTDFRIHDQYSGLAEWVFTGVPNINATLVTQLITLDTANSTVLAGNAASLSL